MDSSEIARKRIRLDSYGDYTVDLESAVEKAVLKTLYHNSSNRYNDRIYIVADKEIHFTIKVDDNSIERLKRLISRILTKHKRELVLRDDSTDGSDSGDDSDDSDSDRDGVEEKKFTIRYVVHSPGGSVASVFSLIDYMRNAKKKYSNLMFESVLTGFTASAGTIMCVVADRKKMTENAFAMIHELSGGSGHVNYTKIESHYEFSKKLHKKIVHTYLKYTGKDPSNEKHIEKIEKILPKDKWFSAEEYKAMGFVDEIV